MPKVYEVTFTKEATITVIAPDGMTDAEVRRLAVRRAYDVFNDAEEEIDAFHEDTISLQDATDLDGEEWRVNDDRSGIVEGEDVDWIEGVIRRREEGGEDEEPVRVSKDQIPLFAPVSA